MNSASGWKVYEIDRNRAITQNIITTNHDPNDYGIRHFISIKFPLISMRETKETSLLFQFQFLQRIIETVEESKFFIVESKYGKFYGCVEGIFNDGYWVIYNPETLQFTLYSTKECQHLFSSYILLNDDKLSIEEMGIDSDELWNLYFKSFDQNYLRISIETLFKHCVIL